MYWNGFAVSLFYLMAPSHLERCPLRPSSPLPYVLPYTPQY